MGIKIQYTCSRVILLSYIKHWTENREIKRTHGQHVHTLLQACLSYTCYFKKGIWSVAELRYREAVCERENLRVQKHHLALSEKTIKSPGGDNEIIPFCSHRQHHFSEGGHSHGRNFERKEMAVQRLMDVQKISLLTECGQGRCG